MMKTIGIMQPYFMPYVGYFQLISAVDEFLIYDNIEYTKKGWINRNRLLLNGKDSTFTLPLSKTSDHLMISQREISNVFDRKKMINKFEGAYRKAPYFEDTIELLKVIINFDGNNLFDYVFNSIKITCDFMGIKTQLGITSNVEIDHHLKSQDKVISLCKAVGAEVYINPIGGLDLYDKEIFKKHKVSLQFIRSNQIKYPQYGAEFVPNLSIVDLLMFIPKEDLLNILSAQYEIET